MKAKSIMIQGTASSVGKSLITAGLCRIFKQDGYKVSPFKSQNMALNSFITKEGREMGRAQVVQAEAAGVEPSVLMNPVLLKPTTDKKAQVIVNGEVYGNMSAVEYHAFKSKLIPMVKETFDQLAGKNDIIVIEGAGSPAEINLRENDIVNMGMAEIADSPVILVGDIDKGGVFASLAGTMLLLTDDEKARVKGVIINKFRGDIELLKPGIKMLEDIIKIPVLGVVPYTRLNIEDEDSLAERFNQKVVNNSIDIAVIKLRHISNFTDFAALENIEDVSIRYVERVEQLKEPDLIILPGSKNTMEDLLYLRKSGIEEQIIRRNKGGTPVFGVCGGYQMLGCEISDPFHTESSLEKIAGMGLLNIKTAFEKEKTTTQVTAELCGGKGILQGMKELSIKGYEIHMGISDIGEGCEPFIRITESNGNETNKVDGVMNEHATVFGTYIHGIFDNMEFSLGMVNQLRKNKGFESLDNKYIDFKGFKETQYDALADILRSSLDMQKIYDITMGRNL